MSAGHDYSRHISRKTLNMIRTLQVAPIQEPLIRALQLTTTTLKDDHEKQKYFAAN